MVSFWSFVQPSSSRTCGDRVPTRSGSWVGGLQEAESNEVNATLSECMRCGSSVDLEDREVEKLVRGGDDVAVLRVQATVCHHYLACGEIVPGFLEATGRLRWGEYRSPYRRTASVTCRGGTRSGGR